MNIFEVQKKGKNSLLSVKSLQICSLSKPEIESFAAPKKLPAVRLSSIVKLSVLIHPNNAVKVNSYVKNLRPATTSLFKLKHLPMDLCICDKTGNKHIHKNIPLYSYHYSTPFKF